jgi:hypothetical protein
MERTPHAATPERGHRTWRGLSLVCVLVVLAGCVPQADDAPRAANPSGGEPARRIADTRPRLSRYADRELPAADPVLSLVGRSDFDPGDLPSEQRHWYERLWTAVDASLDDMVERMHGDDSYDVGRWGFQFNHALLTGLRVSGDLRFLDAVDAVAEAIRAQLDDRWCGGVARSVSLGDRYGTAEEGDGFLNFRFRSGGGIHHCRDTSDLHEAMAHGHLALLMHAYHVNRDSPSPRGIDYGERADFWLGYLRNNFEPKWRERSGVQWPDMDFIDLKFCHTYHQMLLYYAFVGWRLADDGSPDAEPYLRQGLRLTDSMFEVPYDRDQRQPGGFIDVETPLGDAVVYSFGAPGGTDVADTHLEACPSTYARYMLTSVLNLYLEGFPRWDDSIMERLGHGLAYFVMDTEPVTERTSPFAAGVSGDGGVADLSATEYRGRVSLGRFNMTPFAAFAAWDSSGTVQRVSLDAYEAWEDEPDEPQGVHVPAALLLSVALEGDRKRQ